MVLPAARRDGRVRRAAAETVRRELLEELGAEADVGRLVATIENMFTFEGAPGHEICLVYDTSLRDERLYERTSGRPRR